MPVFTANEYAEFDDRPELDAAWDRLPGMLRIRGLKIRWLGPLIELGHDGWVGDLSEAAWGHLEDCGWQRAYDKGGSMRNSHGRIRPEWSAALRDAAQRLADEGMNQGPESDLDRWASWLCFEMSEPHADLLAAATKRGWDR